MDIRKSHRQNITVFSIITGLLLALLIYANSTGWLFFNSDDKKQEWSSKGPGYHK